MLALKSDGSDWKRVKLYFTYYGWIWNGNVSQNNNRQLFKMKMRRQPYETLTYQTMWYFPIQVIKLCIWAYNKYMWYIPCEFRCMVVFLLRFFSFIFNYQCVECNFLWELNQMPFHICMKNIRHRAASIDVHIYNCLVFAVSSFIHRTRNNFDITQTTQRCVGIWLLWGVV